MAELKADEVRLRLEGQRPKGIVVLVTDTNDLTRFERFKK